jgi:hypothetical protein
MEFEFNRKPKTKMMGFRVTEEEFQQISRIAKENNVSVGEACGVLIRAALKEYFTKDYGKRQPARSKVQTKR